ncbi:NADH-quinone oxidoreductase subunit B family protein [Mangrovitalea sediminis]|uniref:NADH-quinone oxidoreductase subunit B family protein n=1 Tax=Mangrovitalea sediminis TaxID=1982043 RepID=UPI000BE54F30|nr:NADH-quinone oxidoreductase subunit NuoB [Mangrovitalea sediminis]
MFRILRKIQSVGIITENIERDSDYEALGSTLKRQLERQFQGSLAIRELDSGSCNACELEIQALNNPYYDVERFGVHFVASPRHADVLLVTGPMSRHMEEAARRTYAAMAAPKWVIAVGDCAVDGGIFGCSYASRGGVSKVLPVDLTIPGCPPSPRHLVKGLLALLDSAAAR